MSDLTKKSCQSCEGIGERFSKTAIDQHLSMIHADWHYHPKERLISRDFHFKDHFEVIAFVNAVAWISHGEHHHPSIVVGYADCTVSYNTHALDGITENDFICASKVDALIHVSE